MKKSDLMRKVDEVITTEDAFVEALVLIDERSADHSHFAVTTFLRLKSGLLKLQDDSRRHKELMTNLRTIIAGDPRDEY
ncbi:MAG: hypothetical protein V1648_01850 [Candidatus Aenigmatarchaeota archaeon]